MSGGPVLGAEAPPRVLMVLKRAGGRGGLQMQARRVAVRMAALGVPVSAVVHTRPRVTKLPPWTRKVSVQYLRTPDQWSFAARLYTYLCRHREEYDVVHVHGFGLETFAAMAARRVTGKPLVVKPSTAGTGTKLDVYARLSGRLPLLSRHLWQRVNAWISISEQTTADLLKLGIPESRIVAVPNGVDTQRFRPRSAERRARRRARFGVAADERVICTIARLQPHKRVGLLIRAFGALAQSHPNARLWIIGAGEMEQELRALAAQTPGSERIEILGNRRPAEVARRLRSSDVFSLVSRWEGLSNALLEALASGLPAVVTDVSGMADVVSHEVSGLVVPVDDEAAVTAALSRLLERDEERARMGAAAAELIRERYGLDATVNRLLALYRACIAGEEPASIPGRAPEVAAGRG